MGFKFKGLNNCNQVFVFLISKIDVLEMILNETNPHWVKAEFDIYWLTFAGERPVDWLKRYQGRTPLVHLKDMTLDGERFFAELGTGGVDLASVLDYGIHSGVDWWIVEQDQSRISPIESVRMSLEYLRKTTYKVKRRACHNKLSFFVTLF